MSSEGGETPQTIDNVLAESAEVLKALKDLGDKQPVQSPPEEVDSTDEEGARREQESKRVIGATRGPVGSEPALPPPRADLVEQLKAESRKAQRLGSPIRPSSAPAPARARPK